jgi:hypothetical protein
MSRVLICEKAWSWPFEFTFSWSNDSLQFPALSCNHHKFIIFHSRIIHYCVYIYTIFINLYIYIYIFIAELYSIVYIYMYMYMYTYIHNIYTYLYTYIYTIYIYIYTIYIYIYIYMYLYIHMLYVFFFIDSLVVGHFYWFLSLATVNRIVTNIGAPVSLLFIDLHSVGYMPNGGISRVKR